MLIVIYGVENFRGHLIREKKRMLEATAGYGLKYTNKD